MEVVLRRHLGPILAVSLALDAMSAHPCDAWLPYGTPVCNATYHQQLPVIVSDAAGGAIITWEDYRGGGFADIYAQRVDEAGTPQWAYNGVPVCSAVNAQQHPQMASDGAGGVIITWQDTRNGAYDIYAQRMNGSGAPQWAVDGVPICTAATKQTLPAIVSDSPDETIVIWEDDRVGGIFGQRVNAAGAPQWAADGVALSTAPASNGMGRVPRVTSDGSGGAIVTWQEVSSVHAQRVNAAGLPLWTASGITLATASSNQSLNAAIVSDDAGGAIVTWHEYRGTWNVYAQRVNAAGVPQWTANGFPVCDTLDTQDYPAIAADGTGGVFVAWEDLRDDTNYHVFAQRLNAAGVPQWTSNGKQLCTSPSVTPQIVPDGTGGAIVVWHDSRGGNYVQRVDADGVPQWAPNGVALSTVGAWEDYPCPFIPDAAGGAIVPWHDTRSGYGDIYAQRVYGNGGVGTAVSPSSPTRFQSIALSPNPWRDGQLTIRFDLPSSTRVSAQVLDLAGHRVRRLVTDSEFSPGTQALRWDGKNDSGVRLPSGVYFIDVHAGANSETRRVMLIH